MHKTALDDFAQFRFQNISMDHKNLRVDYANFMRTRLKKGTYTFDVGEIIASTNCKDFFCLNDYINTWLNSKKHKDTMLYANFNCIGTYSNYKGNNYITIVEFDILQKIN